MIDKTTYYIIENNELHYHREMSIKANADIPEIVDKFIWTGNTKKSEFPLPRDNIRAIAKTDAPIGIWNYFRVIFNETLFKGKDSKPFSYKWPPISDYKSSSPFVSTSTNEPTKKLTLVIHLGSEYAGKELVLEEFRAIECMKEISTKTVEFDNSGRFEWTPERIKRFRYYRARWNWNPDEPVPSTHQ